MSDVNEVKDSSFEQEVVKANGVVLVDFFAPWCGPCKMMSPVVDSVASKYGGKVKFVKMNTDDNPTTAAHYQISGIPSLLLFKNGNVVDRVVGYIPEGNLTKFLDKHLTDKVSS